MRSRQLDWFLNFGKVTKCISFFGHFFWKKKQFSIKTHHLKITSELKSDFKFFVMLSTQISEYLFGFQNFFRENTKPEPNVQIAKINISGHFLVVFQSLIILTQRSSHWKTFSSYYAEKRLLRNIFIPNPSQLRESCGANLCTSTSYFFKDVKKS